MARVHNNWCRGWSWR